MDPEDIDCPTPNKGEPGDEWFCPGCARKFNYVLITIQDKGIEAEAWMTTEIG